MNEYRHLIALSLSTLIGLVAALFGDGWWDVVGWFGLGIPALVLMTRLVWPRFRKGP
ncbi:MAG: hypothetical protein AAGA48_03605 [Myxococcota bacterium]